MQVDLTFILMQPALILFSLIGLISLYFSMIRKSNSLIVILITILSGFICAGYALYLFNLLDFTFQKMDLLTDASSAKEFAKTKTYMFLLLGVGVVNFLSAYKLLRNQ
jgi:ammonia channel protein AmtB